MAKESHTVATSRAVGAVNTTSPDAHTLEDGTQLSRLVGKNAFVCPEATLDGAMPGYDPFRPKPVEIVEMDEHGNEHRIPFDANQLSPQELAQIGKMAKATLKSGYTARQASQAAVEILTQAAQRAKGRPVAQVSPVAVVQQLADAMPANPVIAVPQQLINPQQHLPPVIRVPVPTPPTPLQMVTFERPGDGDSLEVGYLDAYRFGEQFLALVRTAQGMGETRYFPKTAGQRLLVDVHSMPEVFAATASGLTIPFREYEICVLVIEHAVPKGE